MTFFVLIAAVVLVLLAVSIRLGALRAMNALMPHWASLIRNRIGPLPVHVAVSGSRGKYVT